MDEQLLLFVTINPWKSVTDMQATIFHTNALSDENYFLGKCAKTSEGVPRNAFV